MSALYSTKATATGGRAGSVRTDDGLLALNLALPAALGGKGDATNPEQLFAAGYAACFENAILTVARRKGVTIANNDLAVTATVGMVSNGAGGFALTVDLETVTQGLTQEVADELVHTAHAVCPYSNAIKGNVEVGLTITAN